MSISTKLVYSSLLPVFYPGHLMMKKGLSAAVKRAKTAPPVECMLARDPTTADLPSARTMAPEVELDYLEHRSSAYVTTLVLSSAMEAARAITGENSAAEVSNEALARDFSGSLLAHIITRNAADDAWVMDASLMGQEPWWNRDRFEVTKFCFEPARNYYEIHDVQGRVHRPEDASWVGAKRKLIAQASVWSPIYGHAWSHFWLPDVIAATVHESLPHDSNLYRVLAPHVRFANRHNHAGLWIQRASSNEPTFGKKLVPWLAIPLRKEEFRTSLMAATQRYHTSTDHFTFPMRFDRRLPYFGYLGAYYDATLAFVTELLPDLEADVFVTWAQVVETWYPGFAKVPMVQAIAMIIWHMGIAHAVDHLSYVPWARAYGTCEVDPSIDELTTQAPSSYDRYRFLAFVNNFADFRPPPTGLDLRLITSDQAYGFAPGSHAEATAKQFMVALRNVDARLREAGQAIIPVDDLIRAICF